ncbi:hypothetical protein FNH05_37330, partial [Amycolatopsis rhizosphaerae]
MTGRFTAEAVRDLDPGVFAFVMATGIVSFAASGLRLTVVSAALFVLASAGYLVLLAASAWRCVRWRGRFLADAVSPRGFALLTFVAASAVLAGRFALAGAAGVWAVLLALGALAWLVLGYGIPLGLIADPGRRRRRWGLDLVDGTWFLWVVGVQSLAVAALEESRAPAALTAGALVCWAIGLVLYLLLAALGLARLLTRPVTPAELTAPYWVFMGAGAISVLAGARLLVFPEADRLVPHARVAGVSLLLWSFCTWLIPLLVALGVWRHRGGGVPLRYDGELWS